MYGQRHHAEPVRPQRIDFKGCVIVFKALYELATAYIVNDCVEVSSRQCFSSLSHRRLVIPPIAKPVMFAENSLAVGGPSQWNHMPYNVKEIGSVDLSKQRLKPHLFR